MWISHGPMLLDCWLNWHAHTFVGYSMVSANRRWLYFAICVSTSLALVKPPSLGHPDVLVADHPVSLWGPHALEVGKHHRADHQVIHVVKQVPHLPPWCPMLRNICESKPRLVKFVANSLLRYGVRCKHQYIGKVAPQLHHAYTGTYSHTDIETTYIPGYAHMCIPTYIGK